MSRSDDALYMWTVYDHPSDYPDCFIARLWHIGWSGTAKAMEEIKTAPTLEALRALLPDGLQRIERQPKDDKKIVEVWL